MKCKGCNRRVFIDHNDSDGRQWWTCLNKKCSRFKVAFNLENDKEGEAIMNLKDE